ncbi:PIF1-like helicase [Medicago truncatula]|uniref:ATP-dependent DNA helicase n=1 Tax=Medicago truncatula TaxID=3880 RepID=A0A072TES1_MEDTR|nr:PIF1-like helicase [Medicago truncatula]
MPTFTNKLIVDELNYNKDELEKTQVDMLLMLTDEQRCVHDKIMESVGSDSKNFYMENIVGCCGRTAHSTLTVPIEINEASSLTMEKDSPREELVRAAKLIVWDEAPMMHRWCFEAVDRSMRDIMSKNDPLNEFRPFRGMTRVLCEQEEIANFSKWILSIGDSNEASDENGEMKVEVPEDLLISDTTNPLMSLIDFVYPDLNDNLGDPLKKGEYSHQRLI